MTAVRQMANFNVREASNHSETMVDFCAFLWMDIRDIVFSYLTVLSILFVPSSFGTSLQPRRLDPWKHATSEAFHML